MSAEAISCRGVERRFDGRAALAGLDLDVAAGEFVALVGPSGCGKSTLLSLIAGIEHPDDGEIRVAGSPATPGVATLMPQRDALLPWNTLHENLDLIARLAGHDSAHRQDAVRRALATVGLDGYGHYFPHALSGGMRQRGALARALLGAAPCWLLDEPFGALDAITRAQLQSGLARVWSERRTAVLLVTHDIDEALLLADRVVVCSPAPGRIVGAIDVGLRRPRGPRTTTTAEYGSLKGALLDALQTSGAGA